MSETITFPMDDFHRELGKAFCDRVGLAHDTTMAELTAEPWGNQLVVKTTNFHFISRGEWADLKAVAAARVAEASRVTD